MNAELEAKVADTVKQADQLMVRFFTLTRESTHINPGVLNNLHLCCCLLVTEEMKCLAEGTQ